MKKSRSNGLLLWLGITLGCSPCHTGHTEVSYYEAYYSHDEICIQRDDSGWCSASIPTTTYHPARCSDSFFCDLRCEVLDKGKAEAHTKHQTLNLYGDKVDPRCVWERGEARVR